MSGVYIKGMEMPKSCDDCPHPTCTLWQNVNGGERSEKCPLIPVPPHGRLIDADKFCTEHRSLKILIKVGLRRFNWHIAAAAFVDDAPTIIPAEDG